MISTPPTLAGLFFCLASAEGAGLLFLPCSNTATNKRLQRVLHRQCSYTANAAKQCTELCRGFSCDCTRSTAHDTKPTQQAIAQPATRWSAYQRPDALHRYQIPPPRRTLYRSTQPPYYNNVYKGAAYRRPCKSGGVSVSTCTGSARRGLDASHALH